MCCESDLTKGVGMPRDHKNICYDGGEDPNDQQKSNFITVKIIYANAHMGLLLSNYY